MPYIADSDKTRIERIQFNASPVKTSGELNYAIHQLISNFITNQPRIGYDTYNSIIGVLNCAEMELYSRLVRDYEDRKIVENGDVDPYIKHSI